jgi:ATP-dependent Lhr-like helicase
VELEDRRVYGKIWFDGGQFGRRGKYTRVIYYLNLGTIPDEVAVKVYTMNPARYVGSIEEDFLERLKKGDIFVLGGKTYEFRYARGLRAVVKDAEGASPTIPAWFSELLPLSYDLATEIGKYRKRISGTKGLKALEELPLGEDGRRAVKEYIDLQRRYAKVPNDREVLIERTKDMAGRNFLIFHFLYGRRINDALSRIFAITLAKKRRKDVKVVVNDNGFGLIIPSSLKIDVEELLDWVFEEDLDDLLKDNLKKTELMRRRFRHVAARSFLILKNYKGHDISVFRQQMNSETLLKVISSIDESGDFPVVKETYREIMEDVMDLPRAKEIIERLKKKEIRWRYLETLVPSPFAHNLIVLGEADVILMKDRKERIKELHTALLERLER